ncbi:hypothetical protein Mgra_00007053 [Meloidogyne graminicola]|uniref:Uncharacterized protein n=1 Tax=Meloidogyne graminicola TaxID=189291 RepID=A0A8S9ZJX1_9BILA|nr:hypothetical protein Mgra_00007053 [Meloidogyne graminicola]
MAAALIYSTIIYYFASIGLFFNFLLIHLIIRYTMKEMQVYSRILLQTCIVDIIGICLFAITQPVFVNDNGIGTMWSYGIIHYLPNPWQHLFNTFNNFMGRVTNMNVSTLFIYRYLTVVKEVNINFKKHLILIIIGLLPIIILNIIAHILHNPTPENEYLTNYELAKILELDNYTLNNYIVAQRVEKTKNLTTYLANYAISLNIINYIIIIYCGIKIQIKVYKHCKGIEMSQLRYMNKQITIVLVAQGILPLFTFLSNVIANLSVLLNLFNFSSSYIEIFLSTGLGYSIAILNPIVTMLSVRNYRQKIFCCKICKNNVHQVAPMVETTTHNI